MAEAGPLSDTTNANWDPAKGRNFFPGLLIGGHSTDRLWIPPRVAIGCRPFFIALAAASTSE
jgi:hypothetical protein